jgi:hypothetical protein
VVDGTGTAGGGLDAIGSLLGGFDQIFEGFVRRVGRDRNHIGRSAHDKGVPHVEFLVPAALHPGGDIGFGQAAEGVAVMLLRVGMAHSNRSGHTAGLVDHVDVDAQEFGHFGMDDAVAGVGPAAGPPNHPQTTTPVATAVILRLG